MPEDACIYTQHQHGPCRQMLISALSLLECHVNATQSLIPSLETMTSIEAIAGAGVGIDLTFDELCGRALPLPNWRPNPSAAPSPAHSVCGRSSPSEKSHHGLILIRPLARDPASCFDWYILSFASAMLSSAFNNPIHAGHCGYQEQVRPQHRILRSSDLAVSHLQASVSAR